MQDWIYECELFLFIEEVHFIDSKVSPFCYHFCHFLTGNKLDEMLNTLEEKYCRCLNVHGCVAKKELDDFKNIVDSITLEKWELLSPEKINVAQRILQKLAGGLRNDIIQISKEKGYPILYNETELNQ
jgi:hypothetical protein